jgi:hypothetical protein
MTGVDETGLAEAISDSIAALGVLAYPELHARVVEQLDAARVARHAADSVRRLLRAIALLRGAGDRHELDFVIEAEPVAEALYQELGSAVTSSPPAPDLVRLARELLRHLLIGGGFGDDAGAWDRDRDTIPPFDLWGASAGSER